MKTLCIDLRWIDSSGVGVYVKGIMPGIVDSLHDVRIVGLGDQDRIGQFAWSAAPNFSAVSLTADRYSLAEQLQLPIAIPSSTDLFFTPYYTIPLLYRGRLAVTVHDMSHLVVPEITGHLVKRRYALTMFNAIRRRASVVFTVSDFSRSEYLRLLKGAAQPIVTTHLGVSQEWFGAKQLPRIHTNSYFVCVGNVKPYKNLKRLVSAFLSVRGQIAQDLVIVGQSDGLITGESPDFFESVRSGGDRIRLTGQVPFQELLSLVAHADALVMPSLYEGFGLPPLEAMAAGTPVAVSRAASLPEICGDAALYFNPMDIADIGSALVRLGLQGELRERLRTLGQVRSREFSWDACSQNTATNLRSLL